MAITRPSAAHSVLALELDGQFAGWLRSLQPPGYHVNPAMVPAGPDAVPRLAALVSITEMAAEFAPLRRDALLDWALTLPEARPQALSGVALLLDADMRVQRRVAWTDGVITALQLPTLDVARKEPFTLGLRWQPAAVAYPKPEGGKPPGVIAQPRRVPTLDRFRVGGLPFDSAPVLRVSLPTVKAALAEDWPGSSLRPGRHHYNIDLGEVRLDFPARLRDAPLAWVGKVMADGVIDDADYLTLNIDLLDSTLKKTLATVTLRGCSLLGYEESALGQGAEGLATVSLRLGIGQFEMRMAE